MILFQILVTKTVDSPVILPKKSLKFVLHKKNSIITFNLHFQLLPAQINPISEEQARKKYALPYLWPLTANFMANLEIVCRFIFLYILVRLRAEKGA